MTLYNNNCNSSSFGNTQPYMKVPKNNGCCSCSCPCSPPTGPIGAAGATGADGESAYDVAVDNGYTGTESEWLVS